MAACDEHLRRSWLLQRLSGSLARVCPKLPELLALPDEALIAAIGGRAAGACLREHRAWSARSASEARRRAAAAGCTPVCRCEEVYPDSLRGMDSSPATLYASGDAPTVERRLAALRADAAVALVGTRQASDYGLAVAAGLGRALAASGLTVISGMAWGIDSAAHAGALAAVPRSPAADVGDAVASGPSLAAAGSPVPVAMLPPTVAVLPGAPQRSYPARNRALHRGIVAASLALSELGPETAVRPWMFVARNRIIAALAAMTVVVEAPASSGALGTASWARTLGRTVGAVPGQVTSPRAVGANALLRDGAVLVRDAGDVLTALCGPLTSAAGGVSEEGGAAVAGGTAGAGGVWAGSAGARVAGRRPPNEAQAAILDAVATGASTVDALALPGMGETQMLTEIAALELAGWLRRGAGGRLTVIP
jgi:DNA processing protein